VGVAVEGGQARVWVRDAGPGIAAAEREHVWERFYQVVGAGYRRGSSLGLGLGLGLYLSRTIVERHGGQVGLESAPGSGTTVWFRLPLRTPERDAGPTPPVGPVAPEEPGPPGP
jgi:signal transduction histidine kinase